MKETRSIFKKKIRVTDENHKWLKENKDTKTIAGFLDKIINNAKNNLQPGQVPRRKEANF